MTEIFSAAKTNSCSLCLCRALQLIFFFYVNKNKKQKTSCQTETLCELTITQQQEIHGGFQLDYFQQNTETQTKQETKRRPLAAKQAERTLLTKKYNSKKRAKTLLS